MSTLRTWAWVSLAALGAAGGAVAWTYRQGERGKIHKIGKNYLIDARAVSELQRRLKWRGDPKEWVEFVVPYRGLFSAKPSHAQPVGLGPLHNVRLTEWFDKDWTIDDLMIELVQYGLLEEGSEYAKISAVPRALSFRAHTIERGRREDGPAGQYFRVGDTYYVDGPAHSLMMQFGQSRYGKRDVILVRKRGWIYASLFSTERRLPEQRGALFRLEPHLEGTSLEEFLTELVHYGLVGWGGEWNLFPTDVDVEPTGPVLPFRAPVMHVRGGVYYISSHLSNVLMSRVDVTRHSDGRITLHWRGNSYTLDRPIGDEYGGKGWFRLGREDDVQKFVDELVRNRIADLHRFD